MKVNSVMTQPNFTAKVKNKSLLIILVVPYNLTDKIEKGNIGII